MAVEETATVDSILTSVETRRFASGDRVAERYEILHVVGQGGSSVVYAARDLQVGDEVALKVMRAEKLSDVHLKRTRREAAIARGTASPRLVRVFDLEQHGDLVCLPMELVRGGSLRDLLATGALPIDRVLELATEIAEALTVLHSHGIVHRDVKPANLLLTKDGHVKLSDFGLARRWTRDESALTSTGVAVGTVDYLSPEQATASDVDQRSDLYSFGVVLFEMLSGQVPFQGDSPVSSIVARLRETARDVRKLRPDTPRWLSRVVARLLEKNRDHRYATADDVLHDLVRHRATAARRSLYFVAAAFFVLSLAGAAIVTATREPEIPRLVPQPDWGIVALDRNGAQKWARPEVGATQYTVVRRGRKREIAAVLASMASGNFHELSFLDVDTGAVVRKVALPSAASTFAPYSSEFRTGQVLAIDADHDGTDEVIVSYHHARYWPSYNVLYDPATGQARIIFLASGHHLVDEAVDLDGDGLDELLLVGTNNRMGWHTGVAALKILPRDVEGREGIAATPDVTYAMNVDRRRLLWYALNPQGPLTHRRRIESDASRRTLRLLYTTRDPVALTFDGFTLSSRSSTAGAQRNRLRDQSYEHLREANRLIAGGYASDAQKEAQSAVVLADRAGDPSLKAWCQRVMARALIVDGKVDEGQALFRALVASAEAPADVAFEAGRDLHLAGALPDAIEWYRRGLGRGAAVDVGRLKWEFLEGIVLALGEMGRWSEASREVARADASYGDGADAEWYRLYIDWRSGGASRPPTAVVHDLHAYWQLELFLARGQDPAQLLDAVRRQSEKASSAKALFASLHAELLSRMGRHREALQTARSAYTRALTDRLIETETRAHFDLVAERFARLAEQNGLASEASAARRQLAQSRWRAQSER